MRAWKRRNHHEGVTKACSTKIVREARRVALLNELVHDLGEVVERNE